jgi:hypothetical protein
MNRLINGIAAAVVICAMGAAAAHAQEATAIVDRAIQALGGEEALGKIKAASWTTKGTITIQGNDAMVTARYTLQGLDRFRQEVEGEFGGNQIRGVTTLSGDKGVRVFGDNRMDLSGNALANQKRTVYLTWIPVTLLPLKSKEFKLMPIGEQAVDGKPALVVKATGPDGKDFNIYFDKESGLPVRMVARVSGFQGDEFTQETTFSDYRDIGGIKKATRIVAKRNGEKFQDYQLSDFKVLESVDAKTFGEP